MISEGGLMIGKKWLGPGVMVTSMEMDRLIVPLEPVTVMTKSEAGISSWFGAEIDRMVELSPLDNSLSVDSSKWGEGWSAKPDEVKAERLTVPA